ncbi:MAG TPA: phenylalanine--tRNA ligase subunit alpha [Bacteroidales bacterium]|jgi:phenylalanyl-tRNA synthetase alpha chain|nr:phenylalanine--tRNA ligase subunit alpha [Bacteroidales bacterium]NLD63880.1 phenylalanine--tRNA ligase subunit alpha [Bacteroidales bacterium]HNT92423.1 phenylalanine--tRNA ligase subunit alpha [Bacteroidales bacterium]HOO65716.1 phenylalanine--tRNA ligase subunit alpha [Bacteroidales bacterium]HPE21689.1 phenylalanine--tRNA ligase subunit alpha [Bacteroidales bacterium]
MKERIEELVKEIEAFNISCPDELEQFRLKYLSKKGEVSVLFEGFRNVPPEAKRETGQLLNNLKQLATDKYNAEKERLSMAETVSTTTDLTMPAYPFGEGTRHPISIIRNEIIDIFSRIGFTVSEGPEIEDDNHVFSMLNFAADHPARDMQDTFFIEKKSGTESDPHDVLLRTHTSSVQVRVMENTQPPIRTICPGRVFRNEAVSARAHCIFHQVEGLYVAENVSFADLKQALLYFAAELFGKDVKIRLRPSFFPFTEPSAEMDINCNICEGKGCNVCKGTGWLELLGCGMVDPNVLEACGIDSVKYSGYAFGLGIERAAMLKYGVNDLRLYFENDIRFLYQFRTEIL